MTAISDRRPLRLGPLVTGALLVVIGILWLVDAVGGVDVPWAVLMPSALIVVGAALVYGSRTGHHRGLITLGIFLTAAVVLASAVDVFIGVPLTGGVGEESQHPTGLAATEYHWAIGTMTVDLTDATLPSEPIEATVGLGELVVIVPIGLAIEVTAEAGIGEITVFDRTASGISPNLTAADEGATVHLVVKVGMGRVEVRRG